MAISSIKPLFQFQKKHSLHLFQSSPRQLPLLTRCGDNLWLKLSRGLFVLFQPSTKRDRGATTAKQTLKIATSTWHVACRTLIARLWWLASYRYITQKMREQEIKYTLMTLLFCVFGERCIKCWPHLRRWHPTQAQMVKEFYRVCHQASVQSGANVCGRSCLGQRGQGWI